MHMFTLTKSEAFLDISTRRPCKSNAVANTSFSWLNIRIVFKYCHRLNNICNLRAHTKRTDNAKQKQISFHLLQMLKE